MPNSLLVWIFNAESATDGPVTPSLVRLVD